MSTYDLPYYENVLCERMSFIEPFCTDWEAVNVNHLIELKDCLDKEWMNFQRAIPVSYTHLDVYKRQLESR